MKTQMHSAMKQMAATIILLAATPCFATQHVPQLHITRAKILHIEPVRVHVDAEASGAVVRGDVYRGPGYELWQKNHLLVEVIEPSGHTNLSQTIPFSPEPIPRVGRASGRAHFSLALKETPAPGSTVRITPQEGECPKVASNGSK